MLCCTYLFKVRHTKYVFRWLAGWLTGWRSVSEDARTQPQVGKGLTFFFAVVIFCWGQKLALTAVETSCGCDAMHGHVASVVYHTLPTASAYIPLH